MGDNGDDDQVQTEWDFFISYSGADEKWAKWIAVQLETAGYRTLSQVLDMHPGNDFAHIIQKAATRSRRTIAVLSPDYLHSQFGESEWRSAFGSDPSGERAQVVPVMVRRCQPVGLLSTRIFIDLVAVSEDVARSRLLAGLAPGPRPTTAEYPPETDPSPPTAYQTTSRGGPTVSNLPRRNRNFTGRAHTLEILRQRINDSGIAAILPVETIHGLGGVGKTELAIEYAYRFRAEYDIIWWIPAEDPVTATSELARLAQRLGVTATPDDAAMISALFETLRRRGKWLLIYDNAERPDWLEGLLPSDGDGSVIITSRWSTWNRHADPLRLEVLHRDESVAYLRRRLARTDHPPQFAELAQLLGDLPLALEEAAAYLDATGVELADYLHLVRERDRELFGVAAAPTALSNSDADHRSIATIWSLALDRIRTENPTAEDLLTIASFLAPDVPRSLLPSGAQFLPSGLAVVVADPLAYNRCLAALSRYSITTVGPQVISIHRLVASVMRARLEPSTERQWADAAVALILGLSSGGEGGAPAKTMAADLLPHVPVVVEHAQRLKVADQQIGLLLDRTADASLNVGTPSVPATQISREPDLDELASRASNGDQIALRELLDLVREPVLWQIRARTNDRTIGQQTSEDIAQEVLAAIVRSLSGYRPSETSWLAFVYGVVRDKVLEAYRAAGRDRSEPMAQVPENLNEDDRAGPEASVLRSADVDLLRELISDLPPVQREVLMLRVALGYSAEETARVIGSTPGAVRATQHRAILRLRAQIEKHEDGLD